ncbi:MAG: response regulator [Gammaproteobacteria bacterium]|nr:response regulator [Gammaproteobacteria bacterium]
MSTENIHPARQAALDLASKGRAGSLFYVVNWLVVVCLTDVHEHLPALSWGGALLLLLLGLARCWLGSTVCAQDDERALRIWLRRYSALVLALALSWSFLALTILWLRPFDWAFQLSCFTTAGIVSGGVNSLNTHPGLMRAYVLSMLLPCTIGCFCVGSVQGLAYGCLFLFYLVFLLGIGRQSSHDYWSALRGSVLLRERNQALDAARQRAESADRAKSAFLARMSHEIRTPLNGVCGMIELLKRDSDPVQQGKRLATLEQASATLISVINDILDVSKMNEQQLELERGKVVPTELVDYVQQLYAQSAVDKGLDLRAEASPGTDRALSGDAHRLRQVLTNLVSNAVKFTASGEVLVRVELLREDADGQRLRFSVRDTGIGMAPDTLSHVFEAFRQADQSTTRNYGGTGLGLTIARQLVELMGGRLHVRSRLGDGSVFEFELDLCHYVVEPRDEPVSAAGATETGSPERLPALHVLVAEDNLINQTVVTSFLSSLGCTHTVVSTGKQVVPALQAQHYDLVLMDCEMPEMDGLQATAELRALERLERRAPLPIIAVTAQATREDRQRVLRAGMDDYLSKPFSVEALHAVLCRYATRSRDDAHAATGQEPLMDDGWDEVGDEADLVPLTTRSA